MLAVLYRLRSTQNAGEDDREKRLLLCDFRKQSERSPLLTAGVTRTSAG